MKYVDEYRSEQLARNITEEIRRIQTRPWVIMEVCGGQTHSIVKHGLDYLLPSTIELVHGPGCPVCVTPLEMIDKAEQSDAVGHWRELAMTVLHSFPLDRVDDARAVTNLHDRAQDELAKVSVELWSSDRRGFAGARALARNIVVVGSPGTDAQPKRAATRV